MYVNSKKDWLQTDAVNISTFTSGGGECRQSVAKVKEFPNLNPRTYNIGWM